MSLVCLTDSAKMSRCSFSAISRGASGAARQPSLQSSACSCSWLALVQENAELRRLYKHMETQLTFAAEELSGEHWPANQLSTCKTFRAFVAPVCVRQEGSPADTTGCLTCHSCRAVAARGLISDDIRQAMQGSRASPRH